jgi:hypothetical protein
MLQSTTGDLEDEEEVEVDEAFVNGHKKRRVAFMPSLGVQSLIFVCNSPEANVCVVHPLPRYHTHDLLPRSLVAGD